MALEVVAPVRHVIENPVEVGLDARDLLGGQQVFHDAVAVAAHGGHALVGGRRRSLHPVHAPLESSVTSTHAESIGGLGAGTRAVRTTAMPGPQPELSTLTCRCSAPSGWARTTVVIRYACPSSAMTRS